MTKLETVIEQKIRPYLKSHGGDIEVIEIKDKVLKVRFVGKCSGCPFSRLTLEELVKDQITKNFTEIKEVEVQEEVNEELLEFARKILNKEITGDE